MVNYDSIYFDSITALGAHCDRLQQNNRDRKYGTASTASDDSAFYGGWSFKKALECAQNGGGWQKGAEMMPRVHVPNLTLKGRAIDTPYVDSDVVGFAPNVPAYINGVPDSMLSFNEAPQGNKLLRVAVAVGRCASTKQKHVLNRGAAIMAVLDQLSRDGYSIELWALWRNSNDGKGVSIETCVKHGTDVWSPESIAMALCHVSFQRRLCWRVAESIEGQNHGASITRSSYGNGYATEYDDFDLSFGYVKSPDLTGLNHIDTAIEAVKTVVIEQLKEAA
tara:strand:+ start:34645 stop:35481 length:837 start_codon:yes stop_codon:yes gene_type:complete